MELLLQSNDIWKTQEPPTQKTNMVEVSKMQHVI